MKNGVTISGMSGSSFEAGNIAERNMTINYLVQGVARTAPYALVSAGADHGKSALLA